jgi:hypothetical protein
MKVKNENRDETIEKNTELGGFRIRKKISKLIREAEEK